MRIAAVAWPSTQEADWAALDVKLDRTLAESAADLVVLPEYAGMDAALIGAPEGLGTQDWRGRAVATSGRWVALCAALAQKHGCHLLAGTSLHAEGGAIFNRASLCSPSGAVVTQDKILPTPWERAELDLAPGTGLSLFDTALGKIGILVCYDSEFPLLARSLAEAGADMILVPSCTDFPAGQTRVRQSCRARAIEQQCLIVQAPLVGGVPICEIVDANTGRAGIFAPPDHGLPPDGIIAQGKTDTPGPVVAEVDPAAIAAPRHSGQVGNFRHWPEQVAPAARIAHIRLS